jgi:multicomponent Na+:H+ antiporter subunit G
MIINVIAGVSMVGGAALIALGSIGLMRFPDVFTRMHAATKAATVGVIGTTIAASLEASALGGALALLLVVALLFLSGPLGMSLLARAAYHDPETPRSDRTLDVEADLPIEETTSTVRPTGTSRLLVVWLFIVWIAAFGSLAPNVIGGGIVVVLFVAAVTRWLSLRWPRAFVHPIAVWQFGIYFVGRMFVSTWDVIAALWVPRDQIRPAIVAVPVGVQTRNEVALLMNSISFTPGTVALELHDDRLFVHVLTTDDPAGVVEEIAALESKITAAFGPNGQRIQDFGSV